MSSKKDKLSFKKMSSKSQDEDNNYLPLKKIKINSNLPGKIEKKARPYRNLDF